VARSTDAIQRDIERTRDQLSQTLNELSTRVAPAALADEAKGKVQALLADQKVQLVLGGVVAAVVLLVAVGVSGKRREKKQIKEIQRLLANVR
jgi:flagellar basal body-associated protein FliL